MFLLNFILARWPTPRRLLKGESLAGLSSCSACAKSADALRADALSRFEVLDDLLSVGVEGAASLRGSTGGALVGVADVPAAMIWLANIDNPNTRRAYQGDLEAFIGFCGIETPHKLREVTRAHVIAWRGQLEGLCLPPHDDPAQALVDRTRPVVASPRRNSKRTSELTATPLR